jgi:hypothetical protein
MLASDEQARQATAVGNAITRLHREHYGCGATTTRTIYQRNHIVTFLEDMRSTTAPSSCGSARPRCRRRLS